jgi:hypothetical protein
MLFIVKWSLPAMVVIATAVTYVWQTNTVISLGYEISKLKKNISESGDEALKLQSALVTLQRAQRLLEEVRDRNLGLERPSPHQVMSLRTPRPFDSSPMKRKTTYDPPAASGPLANVSAATPHRERSVLRQRR